MGGAGVEVRCVVCESVSMCVCVFGAEASDGRRVVQTWGRGGGGEVCRVCESVSMFFMGGVKWQTHGYRAA